ncbi:72 kDa inositol polyphosphate 5-phosphatase [Oryzias melastigma]|uniref:Phosphatidylinositol polyphosphate 5-phosphatase type IV n=1 Tax=Oryzias melastigma TaxID=30732 RepID=A0A834C949_ORYME|nr:72 kDa inositol polyphosphate 5-phosphatase [Oryzias melastigma]
MSEDGENGPPHLSSPAKGNSVSHERTRLPTPLTARRLSKKNEDSGGEVTTFQPRPPSLPKLTRFVKSVSLEERARRVHSSQESLSDRAETGSSTDSLREDPAARLVFRNHRESPECRESSLSGSDGGEERAGVVRLSPLQPRGPLPALDRSIASAPLRTTNRIDRDCLDYKMPGKQKLGERSHSQLENMGSDDISVDTLRSVYSVLSPIRPQDMRSRSFLEGSVLGSSALLGAEELDRYFPNRMLGIYVVTWNMQGERVRHGMAAGRYPTALSGAQTLLSVFPQCIPANLNDLLLPTDSEFAQDFYVVGVQEGCQDKREWEICIQETLGPHYVMLYAASHGVLYLNVFTRRDLIWFCSAPEHSTVTTRIISQIKTKGALGIALTFFGTSFLFITSHFTSGDAKVYERVLDYNKIIEALTLPKNLPDTNPYRSDISDVTSRFDQVFWFGDFNFRLSKERADVEAIMARTVGGDMSALLEHDQLSQELKNGSIFKGFREAPIRFFPTYKFDIGCDQYDTTSKQRTPSYTDRILFKSRNPTEIKVVKYNSCSSVKTSDHRPVIGVFQVKLRPGRDNVPLCAGQFDRALYLEGIKRRMAARELRRAKERMTSTSTVCSVC